MAQGGAAHRASLKAVHPCTGLVSILLSLRTQARTRHGRAAEVQVYALCDAHAILQLGRFSLLGVARHQARFCILSVPHPAGAHEKHEVHEEGWDPWVPKSDSGGLMISLT